MTHSLEQALTAEETWQTVKRKVFSMSVGTLRLYQEGINVFEGDSSHALPCVCLLGIISPSICGLAANVHQCETCGLKGATNWVYRLVGCPKAARYQMEYPVLVDRVLCL